ncbi:MAG: RNA-binding protein [Gammaproteobacteria bacterium]
MFQRQQLDHQRGEPTESKEAEKTSLLLTEKDPIPYLINEATYPELLRIILDDEILKASPTTKQRRDALKEYALYSKFFKTWLKTPAAQECVNDFSKFASATRASQIQKQFEQLKVSLGFFEKLHRGITNPKVKYAEELARKVLSKRLHPQFCVWLKQRELLRVEVIAAICQNLPAFVDSYNSFSESHDLLMGLRSLKEHNLLSEKNIAFICKVPALAPYNAHVLISLKDEAQPIVSEETLFANPTNASKIYDSFSKLQEAGILEQNREFLYKHISITTEISSALLLLNANNLYERYRGVIVEITEKYGWHYTTIKSVAELLVVFEKFKIADRHRELDRETCWHSTELKIACEALQTEGILFDFQDLVVPILKSQPKWSQYFATALVYLHKQGPEFINERIACAFMQAAKYDEHINPQEFFSTLKRFKMLNEENILTFFPYSRSFATSVWKLQEQGLFEPFKETLMVAFKKDCSTMRSCEFALVKMKEEKIPIEEHRAPLISKPEYLHSFANALLNLHEEKMLYKDGTLNKENYATILKVHEKFPKHTGSVALLLVRLQKLGFLDEKFRAKIINRATDARKIFDCLSYLDIFKCDAKLRMHYVTSLMNEHQHLGAVTCALQAIANKNKKRKITPEQFDEIMRNPRNAMLYAQKIGEFDKWNQGALDLLAISKSSRLLGEGTRCKASLFSQIPDAIASKIATLAEGNGALDDETRMNISRHFLRKPNIKL